MELRKATRTKAKLRIGMAGPSGSGKTYSALQLASGIAPWDKIALIDTENGSGDLYSKRKGFGEYNVITLTAPFTPERYIEAIKKCEEGGMEVIIIDSVTHEWDGEGGLLDVHSKMPGNSFTNWAKITPRHNKFLQAILQSPAHIITTVRKKQDYDMAQDGAGKTRVTKIGLKEIQREGFEYELTLNFELDIAHKAIAGKDRTGLFMDQPEFTISKKEGEMLHNWANEGVDAPKLPAKPKVTPEDVKPPDFEQVKKLFEEPIAPKTHTATLSSQQDHLPPSQLKPCPVCDNDLVYIKGGINKKPGPNQGKPYEPYYTCDNKCTVVENGKDERVLFFASKADKHLR